MVQPHHKLSAARSDMETLGNSLLQKQGTRQPSANFGGINDSFRFDEDSVDEVNKQENVKKNAEE